MEKSKVGKRLYCLFFVFIAFACSETKGFADIITTTVPAEVFNKFALMNATGGVANDFHITIVNPAGFDRLRTPTIPALPTLTSNPPRNAQNQLPAGTTELELRFSGGEVGNGASTTITIGYDSKRNTIMYKGQATWTNDGVPTGSVRIPGHEVKNDPEYTIFNDTTVPLGISDLQFLVNAPRLTNLEDLAPGEVPGFSTPLPAFTLAPNTSMTFFVPGDLGPGMYFFSQGKTFNVNTSVREGAWLFGHQAAVPEPSTWLLLGSGLAGLVLWRRYVYAQHGGEIKTG